VPAGIRVVTERLPFAALLPRVAAVVHHGSVGTTHEVVRAGRPAFVVPHMGDQFFWAETLHARGLGPQPVGYQALVPRVLGERLGALRDPALAGRAQALALAVATEDGLGAAVSAVEAAA
jgi:sterol 3beta-glucosyltransferase